MLLEVVIHVWILNLDQLEVLALATLPIPDQDLQQQGQVGRLHQDHLQLDQTTIILEGQIMLVQVIDLHQVVAQQEVAVAGVIPLEEIINIKVKKEKLKVWKSYYYYS